jgi:prolyl oligopeptidase
MQNTVVAALALAICPLGSGWSDEADPYLWLEDVEGPEALAWVEDRNRESLAVLEKLPQYQKLFDQNLAVYDSSERIPYPEIQGGYVYNFWQDAANERGLWRRATLEQYAAAQPQWEVLLDLDELARTENENWVWKGSSCLAPSYQRCLLSLSRGGADAVAIREFDLVSKSFVTDGFNIPEAKSDMAYYDQDTVFVGTDFGPGSMTESGYPRTTRIWKRGTPLSEARVAYEGKATDVGVFASIIDTPEKTYAFVLRADTFFTSEVFYYDDGKLIRLNIPADAVIETVFHNRLLLSLKTDWQRDDQTWKQGALVSVDLDGLSNGEGHVVGVVEPDARSAISEIRRTRDLLLVNRMVDVRSELDAWRLAGDAWQRQSIDAPAMGQISIVSASDRGSVFFFSYQDFLTPTTLFEADGLAAPSVAKALPAFFDASPYEVVQQFTESSDGTRVPYFRVARKDLQATGSNKTLIYAYGGFEVAQQPVYSATIGLDWLAEGGVYVLANIRGGGEYGPAWHLAAQRENRQKSYDDFYAVAEDLIGKRITSPRHLGIRGGSGGGLLVGMLFTQRPELFGAVVCQVPLLDMKRFSHLLAGASWVAEYGDPDKPEDWAFLKNYSPYHNLDPARTYPRVFFTTSTRDDRVHPGHARKMVAKMNAMGKPNLYYENTEGGHGGAANNRQQARVQALIYAYLLNELEPQP